MRKKFFVAALALLAISSINVSRANAQSCPNLEAFGVRQAHAADSSLQYQIEVTYFTADDPNAFMSERAGIKRSASYAKLDAAQFVAKITQLEREGVASIKKRQSATSSLGEVAALNLERDAVNAGARMINASLAASSPNSIYGLNRETEVSVYKDSTTGGGYYRVSLLSSFVDVTARGAQKIVDYDARIFLKPGQTEVFKLTSDYEVKRSGAARSYVAVTLRSVNNMSLASVKRSHSATASR